MHPVTDGGGDVDAVGTLLAGLPDDVFTALIDGGVKFVAVNDSVVEHLSHLKGVKPRGWPAGKSWNTVPGVYDPNSNTVVIATSGKYGHGSLASS